MKVELELVAKSTGARHYIASGETEEGALLDISFSVVRYGGIDEMSFNVPRESKMPTYRQALARVFVDSAHMASGYVSELSDEGTDAEKTSVSCLGLFHQLEDIRIVSKTYTGETPSSILADLWASGYFSDTDISEPIWNAAHDPIIAEITFEDVTVWEAVLRIIAIAEADAGENGAISVSVTPGHAPNIEEERLVVTSFATAQTVEAVLYEGWQFQSPNIDIDTASLVNTVRFYRAKSSDTTASEFVAAYEDASSIAKYGVREKKITISDYADSTTCQAIADAILKRSSKPTKRAELSEVEIRSRTFGCLSLSQYRISSRPKKVRTAFAEFSALGEFDTSKISPDDVVFDIVTNDTLTGRTAMRATTLASADGQAMEFVFEDRVFRPINSRLFLRIPAGGIITVEYEGDYGNLYAEEIRNTALDETGTPVASFFIVEHSLTNELLDMRALRGAWVSTGDVDRCGVTITGLTRTGDNEEEA